MIIGFSGSRKGLSKMQYEYVDKFLFNNLVTIDEVHHGDCIGADATFHKISSKLHIEKIIIHPPSNPTLRAFCESKYKWEEKDYLSRDRDIIKCSDIVLTCPYDSNKNYHSGTWYCINKGISLGKIVYIIYRNGTICKYNTTKDLKGL
jgi:hypothetical protein